MNKSLRLYFASCVAFFILLPSCHLMGKREAKQEEELSRRDIARSYHYAGQSAHLSADLKKSVNLLGSFVRIPAGSFYMGSPKAEAYRQSDEEGRDGLPVLVEITRPFMMMTKEVSQKAWFQLMKGTGKKSPSYFKRRSDCVNSYDSVNKICPDHPVERVSWNDVQRFIGRLNKSLGLRGCKGEPQDPKGCYRLPTEAEWEYAVRARTRTAYFFGDDDSVLGNYAWYRKNAGERTQKLGLKGPNPWGLYDVYGNVWEWVQDGYQEKLEGGLDPLVKTGSLRVLRGGSWSFHARILRSAYRDLFYPDIRSYYVGFRLVRNL